MLLESHPRKKIEEQLYINIDGLKTIYQILNVQMMADIDIQSFFYLFNRTSEEMGFKILEVLEQDEEEEYISVTVCEEFIKHFIKGIRKILKDIGYCPENPWTGVCYVIIFPTYLPLFQQSLIKFYGCLEMSFQKSGLDRKAFCL